MGGQNNKSKQNPASSRGNGIGSDKIKVFFDRSKQSIVELERKIVATIGKADIQKRNRMHAIIADIRTRHGEMYDCVEKAQSSFSRLESGYRGGNSEIKTRKITTYNQNVQKIIEDVNKDIENQIQQLKRLLGEDASALIEVEAFGQNVQQQKKDLKKMVEWPTIAARRQVNNSGASTSHVTVSTSERPQQDQTQVKPEEPKGSAQQEQSLKTAVVHSAQVQDKVQNDTAMATSSETTLPLVKEAGTMTDERQPEIDVKAQYETALAAVDDKLKKSELECKKLQENYDVALQTLDGVNQASKTGRESIEGKLRAAEESNIKVGRDKDQAEEALSKAKGSLKEIGVTLRAEQEKFREYKIAQESELEQMRTHTQELSDKVTHLTTNLNQIKNSKFVEAEQRIENLVREKQALNQRVLELEAQQLNQQENEPPFIKVSNLTEKIRILEGENDALQGLKNQLQTNFIGLAQEAAEKLHSQLLEEISNLRQQMEDLRAENAGLINEKQQDRSNRQDLAEAFDSDSEKLEGRIKELEEQAGQQRRQFEAIQKRLRERDEAKNNLEQENKVLKQDKQAVATELAAAIAEVSAQKAKIDVLSSQEDIARQKDPESKRLNENKWLKEREALIDKSLSATMELIKSESRYSDLVQDYNELQTFSEGVKEELKNTTDKLREAVDKQSDLESELLEKNTQTSSFEALENQFKEKQSEFLEEQKKVNESKIELEGSVISLEADNQGLRTQLQMAAEKQSDLADKIELIDRSLQKAQEENVAAEKQIESLAGKVGVLSTELAETKDNLLGAQGIFQVKEINLQRQVDELRDENDQLNSKVAESRLQNKRLAEEADRDVDKYKSEAQQQANRIKAQEVQLTQAQGALQGAREENSTLEQQLQTSERAQQGLTRELAAAKKTISEQNDNLEILRQQNQVADNVTDKKDNNVKRPLLENGFDDMALELSNAKAESAELRSLLSTAAREKNDLNDELNILREHQLAEQNQVIGESPLSLAAEFAFEESKNRTEQLSAQLKEAGEKQSELAIELTEKEAKVASLTTRKDQLEAAHQRQIQRAQEAQETIQGLTAKVVEVEKQRDETSDTLKVVEEDKQHLQQERDEGQESLELAQAQLIKKDQELSSFRADIQTLEKKIKEKESLIQKQLEEKADSKIIMGNRDDLIAHLRGDIDNLQKLVDTNKGESANVQRQAIALKEQLKKSQGELQASRQGSERKIAEIIVQKEAIEKKLTVSESVLEQLNKKIQEADSDAVSNKGTIELLQKQKGKTEKDRDAYKLEASGNQQKIEQLTEESKQGLKEKAEQIAGLMKQSAQLTSDYQAQIQKSLEAQGMIKNSKNRVIQLETKQAEAKRTLQVVEEDKQHLKQEMNMLNTELDTAMEKLRQAALDKYPVKKQLYSTQINPQRIKKRRSATSEPVLAEGDELAQQQERPVRINKLSLEGDLNKYGSDDECETREERRSAMTGDEQTVIEGLRTPGDNVSALLNDSQVSTEEAASGSLSSQNTGSSDDNDGLGTPTVVSIPTITKEQKIDEIFSQLTPEIVTNKFHDITKSSFLQALRSAEDTKDNSTEDTAAVNALRVMTFSEKNLAYFKASLKNKLNTMSLDELNSDKVMDELLALEFDSKALKDLAIEQGKTHAKNHLNRFGEVAVAKILKVFEEAAQEAIADRQGTLSPVIDAETLAKESIENPAMEALVKKLTDDVIKIHKANSLDEQQDQARSQINAVFTKNKAEIKLAVETTLAKLEDNQKKQVVIDRLFEKIDRAQVSKALVNQAKPTLLKELTDKGYLLNRPTDDQLAHQLDALTRSKLETVKKKLAATLIEGKTIDAINLLLKKPEDVIELLINTQVEQHSLATQAKEIATKLAQKEIDSYQDKTAQDLESYYQSTHGFIKNAEIRLQFAMQNATSRELRGFVREDRASLENILTLIENGKLDEKKQELQQKLKESGLSPEDQKSYEQAIKSIEEIFHRKDKSKTRIGVLKAIEKPLNGIIAQNDQGSKQTIVKRESSSHFFKVIKTPEELASAREDFANRLSPETNNNAYASSQGYELHTVTEFGSDSTLLEGIRVNTRSGLFKKDEITLTYKAVKQDHIIEFSVDSVNADTRPSFIKKYLKNSDFVRSSTQSMLELVQGSGEGPENKGFGLLILNTNDKNWKSRYALIKAHAALFPKQHMPLVLLEGKYSNASLVSKKSLNSELKKLEDKFIKEYKTQAGSDEYINSFNTQVSLLTSALAPK